MPTNTLRTYLSTSTCPWTFKGELRVFENKTLRYPGSGVSLKTLYELGLFSDKEIEIGGSKISPGKLLEPLSVPKVNFPGDRDVVFLRVRCAGEKGKHAAEVVLDVVDFYDDNTKFTAMERTTWWHASIVAQMMA